MKLKINHGTFSIFNTGRTTTTTSTRPFSAITTTASTKSAAELTAKRYPKLKRGKYANVENSDVQFFEKLLGSKKVFQDENDLETFNTDWLKTCKGQSRCLLKPSTTEEVSAIVSHCVQRNLAICPQGGNTGLVGGSVPVFDEVILSTAAMNKVEHFDSVSGILTAQAGCVLETLHNFVAESGYMMPLDLGAKGSCMIGGNVSTAAGGMRLLRYGSLHAHVLGLEVVLPDENGKVLSCMKPLRKDNTGFHLPHLFVGAEGQLGIVTRVLMTTVPKPTSVNVAFFGLNSFDECCRLLSLAKRDLSEILSSFEFLDAQSMTCVEKNLNLKNPLNSNNPFYILIETAGSDKEHDGEKLERFLSKILDAKLVQDGTVASDTKQAKEIWGLRERVAEALMLDGYTYKQDFSLKLPDFYRITDVVRERLSSLATRVVAYGHLGDGNVHLNITSSEFSQEIADLLYPFLYQWVSDHGGSISAEHGLGLAKRNYGHYCNSQFALDQMKLIKKSFDPKMLLNPYKTLNFE